MYFSKEKHTLKGEYYVIVRTHSVGFTAIYII